MLIPCEYLDFTLQNTLYILCCACVQTSQAETANNIIFTPDEKHIIRSTIPVECRQRSDRAVVVAEPGSSTTLRDGRYD